MAHKTHDDWRKERDDLQSRIKELTKSLEEADGINGMQCQQVMTLEATVRTLGSRVNRLRDRIGKAYDVLAAASSEDAHTDTSKGVT